MKKKTLALLSIVLALMFLVVACGGNGNDADNGADDNGGDTNITDNGTDTTPVADGATNALATSEMGFMLQNRMTPDVDADASVEITQFEGENALRLNAPNGDSVRLGFSVNTLLGDRVSDVANIEFGIATNASFTVSGTLEADRGSLAEDERFISGAWQVISIDSSDTARLALGASERFIAGSNNFLEFAAITTQYGANDPAVIYITSVVFYDADNNAIPLDLNAGFDGPAGYDEVAVAINATVDLENFTFDMLSEDEIPNRRDDRYNFPIAHLIGEFSILHFTFTSYVDNTPAIIFKSEAHTFWAQHQIQEGDEHITVVEPPAEDGSTPGRFEVSFPVSIHLENYRYALEAGLTAERGFIITNWDFMTIESFTIENALGHQVPRSALNTEGAVTTVGIDALRLAPNSTIEVITTPAEFTDTPDVSLFTITIDGEAREADTLIGFSEDQFIVTFENVYGASEISFTDGNAATVINAITVYNPGAE